MTASSKSHHDHFGLLLLLLLLAYLVIVIHADMSKVTPCRAAAFDSVGPSCAVDYISRGIPLQTEQVFSVHDCTKLCLGNSSCTGVNILKPTNTNDDSSSSSSHYICQLTTTDADSCGMLDFQEGVRFYRKVWSDNTCNSLGTSIHPVPHCLDESPCSQEWTKTFSVTENGVVTLGSVENLVEILEKGASASIAGLAGGSTHSARPTHNWAYSLPRGPVVFYSEPLLLDNDRLQLAVSTDGKVSTLRAFDRSSSTTGQGLTVYTRLSCGTEYKPVYDKDSIGNKEQFQAWLAAQKTGSRFVVKTTVDGFVKTYVTSSTLYDSDIGAFAAVTRLDSLTTINTNGGLYRRHPFEWQIPMIHSNGRVDGKMKHLRTNEGRNFGASRSVAWFPDSCREKLYAISSNGHVDPRYDFSNLQRKLLNTSFAPVSVTVEGDKLGFLTLEPDLIVCKLDYSDCQVVSDGNQKISGGLLTKRNKLEITGVDLLDYVYLINGSTFYYSELKSGKNIEQEVPNQKVTWYKSTRPFTRVYYSDKTSGVITGDLHNAILNKAELYMLLTDHSTNQIYIYKIYDANTFPGSEFFVIGTKDVLRPDVLAPGCQDNNAMNRWRFTFQGMKTNNNALLLYTAAKNRHTQCTPGQQVMSTSVEIYANL